MNTVFNPDSWMDVFVLLALAMIAAVPSWAALRNHKSIKEVADSVNNRPTSLRDDVDRAITSIEALAHDVRGLRQDLTDERTVRRSAVADLYTELDNRTGRHRRD